MTKGMKPHTAMHGDDIKERVQEHLEKAALLKKELLESASKPFLVSLNLYNDILVEVDASMSQASLLSQVHPNAAVRKEAEKQEQDIAQFVTELSLNREIYNILKNGEKEHLDYAEKRMLDRTLRDFRRAGVDKDEKTRAQIKDLKAELVTIGQEFGQNIREDRFVIKLEIQDLAGMPKDYVLSHKPDKSGKIEISTDYPDYIPFMQYAHSDPWRKEIRHKYLNRGQKNGLVLQAMMEKRNLLAKLLGFDSYANYIVEDKMIKNSKSIHEFIQNVAEMAKIGADKEYAALLEFKRQQKDKNATAIYGYESAYLEEAYKKAKFSFDSQEVRPYFAYNRVLQGLLEITKNLFSINYVPVPDAKVWHSSVATYDVFDDSGKLGRIFLDMHPRDGKYKHAAQFIVVSGLKDRQYPEGALVCNMADPKDGPALMDHNQVVTMFHEFGHLLHHLFAGRQTWMPFSGVATEWDFVEAPSQLMEEWAWSPDVLKTFAKHYETDEPISGELVSKMRAAKEFGKALAARQQTFYAALSVDYFDKDPKSFHPLEHLKKLQAQFSYFPYEEGTHFNHSFGHLEGYSAMYYTYLFSLVIAKNLFEPFKKDGIMNASTAANYRARILNPGGAKDASDLVTDFLGRPYTFEAFKSWLTSP